MPAARVTAGTQASAQDLNQLFDLLEGVSGFTLAYLLRAAAANNLIMRMSDAAGAQKVVFQDSAGVEVFAVDSDGNITASGGFTPTTLTLPGSTAPLPTVDGRIHWDTDDNRIVVGDGSGQQTFYPGRSGYTLVGVNTTEQTTVATAAADVVTISGLNITVDQPIRILLNYRKTSGSANAAFVGLKLNSTVVIEANTTSLPTSSSVDQAEAGYAIIEIGPRSTNYLSSLFVSHSGWRIVSTSAPTTAGATVTATLTNNIPNATITSVTIRGFVGVGTITLGIKDVYVYAANSVV